MAWNHPGEKPVEQKRAPSKGRGALAGLLTASVLGVAAYFMFADGGVKTGGGESADRGRIKAVTSAPAPKIPVASPQPPAQKPTTVEEAVARVEEQPKPAMKMRQLSPEEWNRLTNRTFRTGTEQLMSWVFSVQPGDMPMPIPNIGEEDRRNIVAILISKNEIKETDSERTAFCKEQVDAAKKEMLKYLKEGGDPDDFLQYYFQELKLAFDKRNDAISQLQETHEEDPELAEQMREAINKSFKEQGIREINKEALE